ncbi:MAG: CehA/McbA family metallohydrolase [Candidatus Aenigmatarchaeota archaeon]
MMAELHSHSIYSRAKKIMVEGIDTPEEMILHAKKIGLDVLAITDHDTIEGNLKAQRFAKKEGIVLIPAAEITTKHGHIVALGIQEVPDKYISFHEALDFVRSQGGIAVAAHPFDVKNEGVGKLCLQCDAFEVFNAINIEHISNWKASWIAKRYKFKGLTAASDAHCKEMMGHGITEIHTDDHSIDSILKNIKKGNTTIHIKYIPTKIIMEWALMRLKDSYSLVLDYANQNYRWPKRVACKKLLRLVDKSPGKIDYMFRMFTYFGLANVFVYKAIREILRIE